MCPQPQSPSTGPVSCRSQLGCLWRVEGLWPKGRCQGWEGLPSLGVRCFMAWLTCDFHSGRLSPCFRGWSRFREHMPHAQSPREQGVEPRPRGEWVSPEAWPLPAWPSRVGSQWGRDAWVPYRDLEEDLKRIPSRQHRGLALQLGSGWPPVSLGWISGSRAHSRS